MRRLYFDGDRKECMNGHIEPITEFYPHDRKKPAHMSSHFRPYCKKCHNEINIRRVLENRRKRFPGSFWDCDNCDHIVSVKKSTCNKCGFQRKGAPKGSHSIRHLAF